MKDKVPSYNQMKAERNKYIMELYRQHFSEYHTEQGLLGFIKIKIRQELDGNPTRFVSSTRTIKKIIEGYND